ncbi:MFS general substrate transporter [Sporormia fimetaria CBS 119925]|uniref:MFS general substrate transporter n=1 Tax=Sporormia fimetaria CBS 119925 TaxID=1340428 RepID=A0A6A6VBN3_9PLEO|nr:MFS general substrate transporter [Sporormia fimetaria CBS 119925]
MSASADADAQSRNGHQTQADGETAPFPDGMKTRAFRTESTTILDQQRQSGTPNERRSSISEKDSTTFHSLGSSDEEEIKESDPEDDFPEGGLRAWLVVLSAFLLLFPTYGFMVSIGTLQDYWHRNQLKDYSSRDVGWIPSVFFYLALCLSIFVGPLFDRYGPRWITLIGSAMFIASMFLLAECSEYWHFMLCVGVLGGIGGALVATIALAVVAHWFKRRRSFAQGIATVGNSFGGLILPLILRSTLPKFGYAWSIRIVGFIFLTCLIVGNFLIKARIPPTRPAKKKPIISLSVLADLRFAFLTIAIFGIEVVLVGALGLLPTYVSESTPFGSDTGFVLISVLNAGSCVGRVVPGYVADKLGRFNTLLVMILFTLVIMLTLWLPFGTTSLRVLYAFAAIFGFSTGSWMALTPSCIGELCRAEEFGRYFGSVYVFASLSTLICIPIGGQLLEAVGPKNMVGFFCAALFVSGVALVFSRWACLGRKWIIRAKV